jgi:hypothetical protein
MATMEMSGGLPRYGSGLLHLSSPLNDCINLITQNLPVLHMNNPRGVSGNVRFVGDHNQSYSFSAVQTLQKVHDLL